MAHGAVRDLQYQRLNPMDGGALRVEPSNEGVWSCKVSSRLTFVERGRILAVVFVVLMRRSPPSRWPTQPALSEPQMKNLLLIFFTSIVRPTQKMLKEELVMLHN